MNDFDDYDDDAYVHGDFYSIVAQAQHAELVEVERQREQLRERDRELAEQHNVHQMSLMQVAGLKSQRELDLITAVKDEDEVKRSEKEEQQRKDAEKARLHDQFPPPDMKHS